MIRCPLALSPATDKTFGMAPGERTHVRLVCYEQVEGRRQSICLFQTLDQARENNAAPPWALKESGEVYGWFKNNLIYPKQFALGSWRGQGQPGCRDSSPLRRSTSAAGTDLGSPSKHVEFTSTS